MLLFWGVSIEKWFLSISIPLPLCDCSICILHTTKSMMWREVASRPLSNKYVLESKYMHIY